MESIDKDFMNLYQQIGQIQGIDGILTSLLGKIYIEPEPVAMDELSNITGYSLASISNKVRILESMGFVVRKKKPGSKKIFFYMEKNILDIFRNQMLKKEKHVLKLIKEKMPLMINKYKKKDLSNTEKMKLKIIENYFKQNLKMESIMKDVLKNIEIS